MRLIGQNLKHLRKAKGLSVEEVREYLCLGSVQAVYKYEKGKSYPPADTLLALMELYGAEVKDIIGNHEVGVADLCGKRKIEEAAPVICMELKEGILAEGIKKQQIIRLTRYQQLLMKYAG